jgi:hypothetical protein
MEKALDGLSTLQAGSTRHPTLHAHVVLTVKIGEIRRVYLLKLSCVLMTLLTIYSTLIRSQGRMHNDKQSEGKLPQSSVKHGCISV